MINDRGNRSAQLFSGGVPLMGPTLRAEAPRRVQERVRREREAAAVEHDDKGRVQLSYTRMQSGNGGGVNRVTLPRFAALERMQKASNKAQTLCIPNLRKG